MRWDKGLEMNPSLPIDFQRAVARYTDAWLISYPATRFLSPHPREQTDGSVMIKVCTW